MKKSIFITSTALVTCFGLAGLAMASGQGWNDDKSSDKSSAVESGMESSAMESSGLATMDQQQEAASLSEDQVRELQNLLKEEGYEVGNADGIIGPDTTAAIRQYQTDRDLEVTGTANDKTLRSLAPESDQQEFFGLAPEFGEKDDGMMPEKNEDVEPVKKGY